MTVYSFNVSPQSTHPSSMAFGAVKDCRRKKGAKILTFDKILKHFLAHSAVTTLQIFCFKIKG